MITVKKLWKLKEEAQNAIPNDPPVMTVPCYYSNDLHKDTKIVKIAQLREPTRILIEQDSDPTLLNFRRKMLRLQLEEKILLNDARYMHYFRNKKRIIIKGDILCRQYYNDLGEVSAFVWTITQSVTTIFTWNSRQTPKQFQNDARTSTKVLLSFNCNLRQKLGSRV